MRPAPSRAAIVLALALIACTSTPPVVAPTTGTPLARMRAGTRDEARAVLGRSDDFTRRMSPADRSFRTKQALPVSETQMLSFAAAQAQGFTPAELARLDRARAVIEAGLAKRGLTLAPLLPADVLLLKTSGDEEYGMPYTRQNAIVLPAGALAQIGDDLLPMVIAHELWHVVSRHAPALRDATYAVIGTAPAPGFTMPAELAARYTTNPDGPDIAFRVQVPLPSGPAWVVALIDYKAPGFVAGGSGNLMEVIELRFLELVADSAGAWQAARDASGALVTHDPSATPFAPCYGQNTEEIVHPDEIIAQSFALLAIGELPARLQVTTPALLDDIAAVIADGGKHTQERRCRY